MPRTRPLMRFLYLVLLCVLCGLRGESLLRAQEPLRTAGDRPVDIHHIRLDLNVDLLTRTVDAVETLRLQPTRRLTSFALDAGAFEVKKVERDGKPLTFSHDGSKLVIDCD